LEKLNLAVVFGADAQTNEFLPFVPAYSVCQGFRVVTLLASNHVDHHHLSNSLVLGER